MAARALSHVQLVSALERRWDYLSARTVVREIFAVAGVTVAETYSPEEVERIAAAIERVAGSSGAGVVAKLRGPEPVPTPPAAPPAPPSAPVEPGPAPEAPEAPTAEAAPEEAAETAPAEGAEAAAEGKEGKKGKKKK